MYHKSRGKENHSHIYQNFRSRGIMFGCPSLAVSKLDIAAAQLSHYSSIRHENQPGESMEGETGNSNSMRRFTYKELDKARATFRSNCTVGQGSFGRAFKGKLADTNQVVAIKQLEHDEIEGMGDFGVKVEELSRADHPNLVKFIGYCVEGDKRLLVNEYAPLGSLDAYLHATELQPNQNPLEWRTRMMIAAGVAKGLEYLHDKMNPAIVHCAIRSSNILLGEGYVPKLSDFGLAKECQVVAGETNYCLTLHPDCYCPYDLAETGRLTKKSDVYSFGVVLLEIITGRKPLIGPNNIITWATPLLKDKKNFPEMVDPALQGHYPSRQLEEAFAIAAMCVQERPNKRPTIAETAKALDTLTDMAEL